MSEKKYLSRGMAPADEQHPQVQAEHEAEAEHAEADDELERELEEAEDEANVEAEPAGRMPIWETIATALLNFAKGYSPRKIEKVTGETAELLSAKRGFAQLALKHKKHLTRAKAKGRKSAEDEANSVDMTLRDARRIAAFGVHELEWKRCLVGKNPDLAFQLDSIVTRMKAIETMLVEPDSDLRPYVPYFNLVLESRGRELLCALQAHYTGQCWSAFKTVRTNVTQLFDGVMTVVGTGGADVPDAAAIWLRERRREAAKAENAEETEEAAVAA